MDQAAAPTGAKKNSTELVSCNPVKVWRYGGAAVPLKWKGWCHEKLKIYP